ncbi:uncharacterized protein METZ01_LOCUS463690, partial [marine metagenome]
ARRRCRPRQVRDPSLPALARAERCSGDSQVHVRGSPAGEHGHLRLGVERGPDGGPGRVGM